MIILEAGGGQVMLGRNIGPYQITALLGKGGMGEVYEALDSRLDRKVALKILPDALAHDPDRLARFEREAKVLASLQHQNIASIFGLEDLNGQPVLVMELAAGVDLTERIAAGNLTGTEIEKIACQLARGLEYAHENGIVHRDLKPANIKIYGDGQVKILDFGLARAFAGGTAGDSATSPPLVATATRDLTVAGTVMGTAAYMSPEQARGYDVDRRCDIWAFGVILHEMLTKERLFEGETASDTMAAILRKEPEWERIPADASPLLVQICRRCLEKDPQRRMRDIGEVRVALEGTSSGVIGLSGLGLAPVSRVAAAGSGKKAWFIAGSLAMALVVVAFLGVTGMIGPKPETPRLLQASIDLPEGVQLNLNPASPGPVVVSPDSRRLAFSAVDTNGQVMLYVRDLDQRVAQPVPGTVGAHYPFWGPDSRTVGFFTGSGKLARVDISGGPIVNICAAENGKGGSWHANGMILFAASHISSIALVPASGGDPVEVTNLRGEKDFRSHRFPVWLPDGKSFLYIAVTRAQAQKTSDLDAVLRYATIDKTVTRELMPCQASVVYAAGQVLFVHDNILMARKFGVQKAEFLEPARPILGGVLEMAAAHLSVMSASDTGVLAYSTGGGGFGNSQLFSVNPQTGKEAALDKPLMTYGFSLSPNGNDLILSLPDHKNGTFDVWILDMKRDLRTRFTFDPESEMRGIWSPDGQWITYESDNLGRSNIYRKRVSGISEPELLFPSTIDCTPGSWSHDGNLLTYTATDTTGKLILGLFDLSTSKNAPLHGDVVYNEGGGDFSPDDKWLTYMSAETGQTEVFVESNPQGAGRWRVSGNGGFFPQWSPRGDKLYFLNNNGEIYSVDVAVGDDGGLQFGSTAKVTDRVEFSMAGSFVVDPTTGHLIVQRSVQARQGSLLSLITPWQNLLERR